MACHGIIARTMTFDTLTIIGVGLIGGSVGLAARERRAVGRVLGVGRSPAVLELAQRRGCIDAPTDLAEAAAQADLVLVCTPVDRVVEFVREAAQHARPGTVITDAGGTKNA